MKFSVTVALAVFALPYLVASLPSSSKREVTPADASIDTGARPVTYNNNPAAEAAVEPRSLHSFKRNNAIKNKNDTKNKSGTRNHKSKHRSKSKKDRAIRRNTGDDDLLSSVDLLQRDLDSTTVPLKPGVATGAHHKDSASTPPKTSAPVGDHTQVVADTKKTPNHKPDIEAKEHDDMPEMKETKETKEMWTGPDGGKSKAGTVTKRAYSLPTHGLKLPRFAHELEKRQRLQTVVYGGNSYKYVHRQTDVGGKRSHRLAKKDGWDAMNTRNFSADDVPEDWDIGSWKRKRGLAVKPKPSVTGKVPGQRKGGKEESEKANENTNGSEKDSNENTKGDEKETEKEVQKNKEKGKEKGKENENEAVADRGRQPDGQDGVDDNVDDRAGSRFATSHRSRTRERASGTQQKQLQKGEAYEDRERQRPEKHQRKSERYDQHWHDRDSDKRQKQKHLEYQEPLDRNDGDLDDHRKHQERYRYQDRDDRDNHFEQDDDDDSDYGADKSDSINGKDGGSSSSGASGRDRRRRGASRDHTHFPRSVQIRRRELKLSSLKDKLPSHRKAKEYGEKQGSNDRVEQSESEFPPSYESDREEDSDERDEKDGERQYHHEHEAEHRHDHERHYEYEHHYDHDGSNGSLGQDGGSGSSYRRHQARSMTQLVGGRESRVYKRDGLSDIDILNFALTLEHVESAFYKHGLEKYSSSDFESAGYPSWVRGRYEQIQNHDETHVEFLESALGTMAVGGCSYNFVDDNVKQWVEMSFLVENVGTSAYNGVVSFLQDRAYMTVAASILGVEARHAAWINGAVRKENPWNTAFETPLDMNQAFTLASSFIVPGSCPSSNLPIPASAFPNLKVPSGEAGEVVKLDFSSEGAGSDTLYAAFITGAGTVFVQLCGEGKRDVQIPEGLEGIVYVIVTKDGESVRDETTVAGPAVVWFEFGSGSRDDWGNEKGKRR